MSRKFDSAIRERVRAGSLCEYCHSNERWQCVEFTLDHVDPSAGDDEKNLALACFHCNRRKSNLTEWRDPQSGQIAKLFDPRTNKWSDHFQWDETGLLIDPKTNTGRATVDLLDLNRLRILRIREADIAVDRHPPLSDQ